MLRLLYVDDDDDLAELAMFALGLDPDIEVTTAGSGALALEQLGASPTDVVLLDVMMPGMDGPAVLAALRGRSALADLPVIFVTARVLPEERQRLLALGAAGVITKPFDPMTFAMDVRKILAATDAR